MELVVIIETLEEVYRTTLIKVKERSKHRYKNANSTP